MPSKTKQRGPVGGKHTAATIEKMRVAHIELWRRRRELIRAGEEAKEREAAGDG